MTGWLLATLLAFVAAASSATAHDLEPSIVVVRETAPRRFAVHAVAGVAIGGGAAELTATLRAPCAGHDGAFHCPGAEPVRLDVRPKAGVTFGTPVLVRFVPLNGSPTLQLARGGEPLLFTSASDAIGSTFADLVALGIGHVLSGPDHLLFLLGLLVLAGSSRRLLATTSAFTLAHAIATLAVVRGVRAPSVAVESLVALSIVYVAREGLLAPGGARERDDQPSGARGCGDSASNHPFSRRHPELVAFAFGLAHGFAFAAALDEHGITTTFLAAVAFNGGVELGQLLAVALTGALLMLALGFGVRAERLRTPALYGSGAVGAYWLLERLSGLITR